jgi:hypothetical protein
MSATNGVIVGGGRIGSFLYESNGNSFTKVYGDHCVSTKRSFSVMTSLIQTFVVLFLMIINSSLVSSRNERPFADEQRIADPRNF